MATCTTKTYFPTTQTELRARYLRSLSTAEQQQTLDQIFHQLMKGLFHGCYYEV